MASLYHSLIAGFEMKTVALSTDVRDVSRLGARHGHGPAVRTDRSQNNGDHVRAIYPKINIQVFYQKDFRNLIFKHGLVESAPKA